MTWDDELAELTARAFAAFGDEAVGSAFVRAVASAPALELMPAVAEQVVSDCELRPVKCVDASTSAQHFKIELRRLLAQH
jgi:hypothetical protein